MMKRLKIYALLVSMLITFSLLVGCGTKDNESSQISDDIQNLTLIPTVTLSPTPIVTFTPIPTPIVTPTPTPAPTTEPLLYKQIMPNGAFPTPEDYGDFYSKLNTYEHWLLTDEGILSRIDYVKEYLDVTDSEASYLLAAYYTWNYSALDPVNFNSENEAMNIHDWISYMSENEYIPEENSIQYIVEKYKTGDGIYLENWEGSSYADLISFYEEVEATTGDIHSTDTYLDNQMGSIDTEVKALPISSNGEELKFGDKVKYEATGLIYFGGTVYEVDGSKVKVKWEVKGDMFTFPSSYLTKEEKDPASMMLNIWGQPSDTEEIDASVLEKVSYLLW